MWSLLELRLRSDATGYALALLTGVIACLAASFYGRLPADSAEGVIALAAGFALVAVWLYQRYRAITDHREHRIALHAALPLPLSRIAAARTLEPVVVYLVFGSVALALVFAFRTLAGSPSPWAPGLLALVLALVLFVEQMQLAFCELKHRVSGSRWGKFLVRTGPGLVGGVLGGITGYYGSKGLLADISRLFFDFLITGPFILSVLAGAVFLAVLNRWLFVHRRFFSS
jgi:hypothetical protein